jgi:GDPmannose 4,6-dehydratase
MKKKIALITGITGQDGSYLAELLLKKNYIVHGLNRRTSSFNTKRIDHIFQEHYLKNKNFILHYGDMTDSSSLNRVINSILPDEIYNLAAQSHVYVSFEAPEYTADTIALGTLRILECIRSLMKKKKIKFYNASTSEMFGNSKFTSQNEKTPFAPESPYGAAKLYAHWITKNYRDSYKIFSCNGILFNHESPRRGNTFVTQKIITELKKIKKNKNHKLYIGNLYAKRDWGHAKEYVEMQYLMLQNKKPIDYVISTGKNYSVKHFINLVAKKLKMKIRWTGKGLNEKGYLDNKLNILVDKKYFRPSEVNSLLGDSSKAARELKWKPKITIHQLIDEMILG